MGEYKVNIKGDREEVSWHAPSKHYQKGVYQYTYCCINKQNVITTPASSNVNIIFVMAGGCYYEGAKVKQGDVFLYGINKKPVTSFLTDIALFSIKVDDTLMYRYFNLLPSLYYEKAMCLPKEHILCRLGKNLLEEPMERWVDCAELFLEALFWESTLLKKQDAYECVLRVASNLKEKGYPDDTDCCKEFGISRRHLQRQFIRFFGITMRDYERILRFSKAFCRLDENSLADTALCAGYYDQSHMNREFKQMAGASPYLLTQHVIYHSLKEAIRDMEVSQAGVEVKDGE